MHMYIYINTHTYIYIYIYIYICVYTHMCIYIRICIYVYICICIHISLYIYIYVYIYMGSSKSMIHSESVPENAAPWLAGLTAAVPLTPFERSQICLAAMSFGSVRRGITPAMLGRSPRNAPRCASPACLLPLMCLKKSSSPVHPGPPSAWQTAHRIIFESYCAPFPFFVEGRALEHKVDILKNQLATQFSMTNTKINIKS